MMASIGSIGGYAPAGWNVQDYAPPISTAKSVTKDTTVEVAQARTELAAANSLVDTDKRNHSPGCVACDQKLVDKAQIALAQATAKSSSTLDITI